MRISPGHVVAIALSLALPIGAGCSVGATGGAGGAGGAPGNTTGEFQPDDLDVAASIAAVQAAATGAGVPIPPGVWLKHYGDLDEQHASAVASSLLGEIAVAGTARGTIDFGNIPWAGTATDTDVVVAKLTADGQSQWSRRYGDACDQRSGAVAHAPSGNVVLAGDFCGKMIFGNTSVEAQAGEVDAFVAMIDTLGEDVFSRSFGGAGAQIARGVTVDTKGNTILVGSFDQAFDDGAGAVPSMGMDDAFVVKLDPGGKLLWSLTFGGAESDLARGVTLDAAGNLLVGGTFGGSVDFGGGPLTATPGHSGGFVLELDPGGKHLWSQSFVTDGDTVVTGVAVGPTGNVAATGYFKGTGDLGSGPFTSVGGDDVFLTLMDGTGKRAWARTFGGPETQRATGVAFGPNGDVMLSGTSDETLDLAALGPSIAISAPFTSHGPNEVYAVRFNPAAAPVTGQIIDGATPIESIGIGFDQKFGTILAGSFQQKIGFQFGSVVSAGGWDVFVTREW